MPEMGWDRILSHGQRLERPWEECIKANKELMTFDGWAPVLGRACQEIRDLPETVM